MKIILISGFLGAGKTTFIKKLTEQLEGRVAILENDFGSIGVDKDFLLSEKTIMDEQIFELIDGCICCSKKIDFSQSVLTISNSLDIDYLIIESSGVALTNKILDNLNKIRYERIKILPPIMIIDGIHYEKNMLEYPEYFINQIKHAGSVLVSHSEEYSKNDYDKIRRDLKINDSTYYPNRHYENFTNSDWENLYNRELYSVENEKDSQEHSFKYKSVKLVKNETTFEHFSLNNFKFYNIQHLLLFFELIINKAFGNIIRAKGYCKLGDKTSVKFDLVGSDYVITGCEDNDGQKLLLIGNNFKTDLLEKIIIE